MASLNDIETKVQYIIGLLDARTTKTITGVLPLTFTTTEDKLRDWTIYGNDDVHDGQQGVGQRTENLFDKSSIETYKYLNADGTITSVPQTSNEWDISDYIPIESSTQYWISKTRTSAAGYHVYYDSSKAFISSIDANNADTVITSPNKAKYIRLSIRSASISVDGIMLVKGSTAPSSYVTFGYEMPISCEQNLINSDTPIAQGTQLNSSGGDTYLSGAFDTAGFIDIAGYSTLKITLTNNSTTARILRVAWYDASQQYLATNTTSFSTATYIYDLSSLIPSGAKYLKFSYLKTDTDVKLLTYSQNYTFYIDSPLTAGQSISKTSTGVDIATTEGENTISTTLYNKPEMTIKYK